MPIDLPPDAPVGPPEPPSAVWIHRLGWAVLVVAIVRVILVAGRLMWFTAPMADELEQAAAVRHSGAWHLIVDSYCCWTGRWSGIGIFFSLEALPNFRDWYPWLLIATQVTVPIAVYALLSAAFGGRLRRWTCAVLALGLTAVHWDGDINLWDSYYWLTGAVENRLSLSLGMFTLAGLLRSRGTVGRSRWSVAGLAVLAALTTGMHQLYGLYLLGILAIGTGLTWWTGSANRGAWTVTMASAAAGFAANLLSPGNATRLAFERPPHELWWFKSLLQWWKVLFVRWLGDVKLWLATMVILCHPAAAAAAPAWLRARRYLVASLAVAAVGILFLSVVLANWWSLSQPFPWRTQAAVYLLFLIGWFAAAYALAPRAAGTTPRIVWTGLAACLALALTSGRNYIVGRDDYTSGRATGFLNAVRDRDRLLRDARAAGNLDPRVSPIADVPTLFAFPEVIDGLHTDAEQYRARNGAWCAYYDLHSIGLTPSGAPTTR
jgi:hypothetical protein